MRFSVKKTFFTSGFPNFPLKSRKTNVILLQIDCFSLIVYCFCILCRGELFRKDVKTASSGTTLTLTPDNRDDVVVTAKKAACFGG